MKNELSRESVISILTGSAQCSGAWVKLLSDEKLKRLLSYWAVGVILHHKHYGACTAYRDTIAVNFLLKERVKLGLGRVSYYRKANEKELERARNYNEFYQLHMNNLCTARKAKEDALKYVENAFSDKLCAVGAVEYIDKCLRGEKMFNVNFALPPSDIIKNSELLKVVML